MDCPLCGHSETSVLDSRPSDKGKSIRRRRVCEKCDERFTTFERVTLRNIIVVKSDKRREPFDRDKLVRSITLACKKRPITETTIQNAVNDIQRRLEQAAGLEVKSRTIGEMMMECLKDLDEVAYVRFASVYKDFKEGSDFRDFLKEDR